MTTRQEPTDLLSALTRALAEGHAAYQPGPGHREDPVARDRRLRFWGLSSGQRSALTALARHGEARPPVSVEPHTRSLLADGLAAYSEVEGYTVTEEGHAVYSAGVRELPDAPQGAGSEDEA